MTSGSFRIQEWLEHRRELERAGQLTEERKDTIELAEVSLIAGQESAASSIARFFTKRGKNIPNRHKIYQISTKYTKWP
jgi:hypothetical protein